MKAIVKKPNIVMLLCLLLISIPHLIDCLLKWHQFPIHEGIVIGAGDPDPWMRLALVRDWLTSGNWYDHIVSRSNAPFGGIATPWTRPLDVVIAALTYLQPESVELNMRLMRAAALLPWLWMTLLLLGLYRFARNYSPSVSVFLMINMLIASMPVTWNYFGTANADHHAPLATLFIWSLAGIVPPKASSKTVFLSGVLLGLQLWVSFETLILIGIIYAWFGILWLKGDYLASRKLATLSLATAAMSIVAVAIEHPPSQWLIPTYDAISIVYVVILLLAAISCCILHFARSISLANKLFITIILASVCIICLYMLYPLALKGPLVEVTPFVLHEFLPRIREVQSLFAEPPPSILGYLIQPLLAAYILSRAWTHPDATYYDKRTAAPLAYILAATTLLLCLQLRWSYYLFPFVAVIIAPWFAALFSPMHPQLYNRWPSNRLARLPESQQATRRIPIILLVMGAPMLCFSLAPIYENLTQPSTATTFNTQREVCYTKARRLIHSGNLEALRRLPDEIILAPTDLGAEILFFSNYKIIGSNYHREGDAIEFVWQTEKITDPNELRTHLHKRKVSTILLCPNLRTPKDSIFGNILKGKPAPAWMHKVPYTLPPGPVKEDSQPKENIAPLIFTISNP